MAFDEALSAFTERQAFVFGGSTDNEYSHLAWRSSEPQLQSMRHPLLFVSPTLAQTLGIVHPTEGVALRATLIIDPSGMVRFASANDLNVGAERRRSAASAGWSADGRAGDLQLASR